MTENELPVAPAAGGCWGGEAETSPGATQDAASIGKGTARAELIAKVGTVLSAIMASSCCWLPPLLILMGFSGAGMVATLETYRYPFMAATFGFLGFAFYLTYRPKTSKEDCCAPAASGKKFSMMTVNKIMLWAVTAMAIVFLFFPQVITNMFAGDGEFGKDMTQIVIHVDGMTCPGWELKAETALSTAPGVLKAKANYETGQATIGIKSGDEISQQEVLDALKKIGYSGTFKEAVR